MQVNHPSGKNLEKRLAQNPIEREKNPVCFLFFQNVVHLLLGLFALAMGQMETGNALLLGLRLGGQVGSRIPKDKARLKAQTFPLAQSLQGKPSFPGHHKTDPAGLALP
jgi:hypothetical protein